ncbi:restriction endonuclease subunit S [Kosakonia cowanii]|uniref:restriction endonuclease subunit S n=1 Tax=Kosakonia cowanii TaxID=208223 RepID=UPI0028A0B412|nr:restriction endonuclease subunit S [Kosakonia cowanii]
MSAGKLPEGWVDTQLGNVVDYGKTSKKVLSDVNDDTWILELEDIEKDSSKLLKKVTASERPFKSTKNSFRKGDILYGKLRPYLNKIIIANDDGVCTTEIIPINAEPICFNKYLFYWLKSSTFLSYVNDVSYGVNMPRLGTTDGLKAPLRLAPLAEQKIIAEKLDTLLAQVDGTKARLEQIPQILKRFRQAVLVSAVEGRLNNFDSKKWKLTKIENLVRIVNGKSFPSTDYQNNGVKLLRPGNLHKSGTVIWTDKNTTYLPKHWVIKRPELSLKGGALLMNLTAQSLKDEFLGRVCILNESDEVILLNQRISAFTSNVKYNVIPYLFIYFKSPQFRSYIDTLDSGTLIKHLNIKNIKSYSLKLPSEEEQAEIVRRVEQLFAYADTIEKQVNNALARVNNLTQSILAKAFRGELTAQWRAENPDLISGENSAAALLEKIKAERAASGDKKGSRKKS